MAEKATDWAEVAQNMVTPIPCPSLERLERRLWETVSEKIHRMMVRDMQKMADAEDVGDDAGNTKAIGHDRKPTMSS